MLIPNEIGPAGPRAWGRMARQISWRGLTSFVLFQAHHGLILNPSASLKSHRTI